ncbi:proton-coupled amino acid transporter 3-like [Pecten maximus]|uniref:proton-coupled amino acid transporter 3-like n=1 Tax=Pecten maximus TaxID=6579 RepID=UPI001458AF02|nr:proton-coupled amino acid transporter 3-like [Pecten maximus]
MAPVGYNDTANSETEQSEKEENLSDLQGLMMLIPYYIGLGFLGLPYMVKLLGLWTGLGGLLIYGFLNEVCILILVDCAQRLTKRTGERFGDIVRVAEMSMTLGPPWLRPHAGKYKLMVQISLLLNHFLFLADMLSLMSMFAQDYICRDLPGVSTRVAKPASYLTFTTFANDVMFTLDGASGVLPIRHLMKTTKHFDGWNGVLGVALMFVTSFHAACGFYGYLKFGEMTHVMYLLNLPLNNWYTY